MADLDDVVRELENIKTTLEKQNERVYKILLLTITGAFMLVGIKLVIP